MKKAIVVITGAKFAEAKRTFTAGQYTKYFEFDGKTYKMNAGAGSAYQLHEDYELIVHGYNQTDGDRLAKLGLVAPERYHAFSLLDKSQVKEFVGRIAELKQESGLPVHVVHYGAASETNVVMPHGNSLRHTFWEAPGNAIRDLVANNCETLMNLMQEMKRQQIFEDQAMTKVVVVTAAAAVRAKAMLGLDSAQKGAGHNLLRSMALELAHEQIYITEVMPGSTDGGYYDNDHTLELSLRVSKSYGFDYDARTIPVFSALQIGESVKYVMDTNCNVREVVLLPYGQHPHVGA
ncbi:MAG TPA: SDR family NAD(P)-dependent oxidoreductase [Candidatus Saccharimonadales bacterium]|jgi:NAD(P)-dependent dehydrogenase (short-subunit alcohol dehydrogenase family)